MDLDEIRNSLDRRQSPVVLQALRDETGDVRRMEIANVLGWLNDPRLVKPLHELMIGRDNPEVLRQAASAVLRDMTNSPDPEHGDLEQLWNSGDLVLQRHALGFMTWRHQSMFGPVLDDPQHPLYEPLISELRFAFPFPRFAEALVRALGDPRADVRYQAAESLVWTIPALALDPLIDALDDPDTEVKRRVIETLQHYSSRKARKALQACVGHDDLGTTATAALAYNSRLFEPGEENNQSDDQEDATTKDKPTGRPDWLRSATAFKKRFGNLDTRWAPLATDLNDANWNEVSRFARGDIADFMLTCPDVLVRQHAATALADWGDMRVRNLLDDRYFAVAKSAGYAVRHLKPSGEIADQLWTALKSASGVHAIELLESFVALSADAGWQAGCVSIARDQYWEESVRDMAINCLFDDFFETGRGGDKLEEIAAAVLTEPPVCSWALHDTILERSQQGRAIRLPDLDRLKGIDHDNINKKIAGMVP